MTSWSGVSSPGAPSRSVQYRVLSKRPRTALASPKPARGDSGSRRGPGVGSERDRHTKPGLTPQPPHLPSAKQPAIRIGPGAAHHGFSPRSHPRAAPSPKVHPRAADSAGHRPHPDPAPAAARKGSRGLGWTPVSTFFVFNPVLTALLFTTVGAADRTAAAFSSTPMRLSAWCGD